MTRRPGTESSSRGSIGPLPARPTRASSPRHRPLLLPPSPRSPPTSTSLLCSPTIPAALEPRRSPKRPSYSFVRPNFYERLPARESRNCLFSGTPGTSWSRPRHREIESSGFSPRSLPLSPPFRVFQSRAPLRVFLLSYSGDPRSFPAAVPAVFSRLVLLS